MNPVQKITRTIILHSFHLSVAIINCFYDMGKYRNNVTELSKMNRGSLGKEIADCLEVNGLTLVPKFESHDLKHVLLDYKMTPVGEIRLQAFMIGNGNYSLASFAIFIFGAALLPELWRECYSDFQKGRNTKPISDWTIEQYAHRDLVLLREEISLPYKKKAYSINAHLLLRLMSVTLIVVGGLGMIYCLPYLYSSNMTDLVGAGFPFVGGAILLVGGLNAFVFLLNGRQGPILSIK